MAALVASCGWVGGVSVTRSLRHDAVDVGFLIAAVDDAAGGSDHGLDPAGGLFGQHGTGSVLLHGAQASLTVVRICVMFATSASNSARMAGRAAS